MKHLALMRVVDLMRPERYLESHAGGFDYPLAERSGPLPDGVWDFLSAAPMIRALDESDYAALLRATAGTPAAPGTYPGSTRCVWETCGADVEYRLNDVDSEALGSIGRAFGSRGARVVLSSGDGIDMVLDEARAGDLVLIDPFDPEELSPKHGLSAVRAFEQLIDLGVSVLLWRALDGAPELGRPVRAFDLRVTVQFDEATGSMDGCEFIAGNVPPDVAAEIGRLAIAHGAVLTNGQIRLEGASGSPRGPRAKRETQVSAPPAPASSSRDPARAAFDRYVMVDWSATNTSSPAAPSPAAIRASVRRLSSPLALDRL